MEGVLLLPLPLSLPLPLTCAGPEAVEAAGTAAEESKAAEEPAAST